MKPSAITCAVLQLALLVPCRSQQNPAPAAEPPASAAPASQNDRFGNVERLPSWVRVGLEFRGRGEANFDPEQDRDDRWYLNRLRLSATVQPARWSAFSFRGRTPGP